MQHPQSVLTNTLDSHSIRKASIILRTLNNKVCQKIYDLLYTHKEMTVTQIFTMLEIEQSVASMHLAKMRRQRFVLTQRNGKNIFYGLDRKRLSELNKVIVKLAKP